MHINVAQEKQYEKDHDVVNYLKGTFKYPLLVLAAMLDTGSVISGSRALEFFVKGSLDPSSYHNDDPDSKSKSDWDFYVPGFKESVVDMVRALSICGVKWDSRVNDWVGSLMEKKRICISKSQMDALTSWTCMSDDLLSSWTCMSDDFLKEMLPETELAIAQLYMALIDRWGHDHTIKVRKVSGRYIFQAYDPKKRESLFRRSKPEVRDGINAAKRVLSELEGDNAEVLTKTSEWEYVMDNYVSWRQDITEEERVSLKSIKKAYEKLFDHGFLSLELIEESHIQLSLTSESSEVEVEGYTCFGQPWNALYGTIETSNGTETIQLMIGMFSNGVRSIIDTIRAFYASHTQCFISGWCAAHMYYTAAKERKGYKWALKDGQKRRKVDAALKKYGERRGYTFEDPKIPDGTQRRLFDDEARFVSFDHIYHSVMPIGCPDRALLDAAIDNRLKNLQAVDWVVSGSALDFAQNSLDMTGRKSICRPYRKKWLEFTEDSKKRFANIVAERFYQDSLSGPETYKSSLGQDSKLWKDEIKHLLTSGTARGNLADATPLSWAF